MNTHTAGPQIMRFPLTSFCCNVTMLMRCHRNLTCLYQGVQPAARGQHAAQDGCECSPTQNHKFT